MFKNPLSMFLAYQSIFGYYDFVSKNWDTAGPRTILLWFLCPTCCRDRSGLCLKFVSKRDTKQGRRDFSVSAEKSSDGSPEKFSDGFCVPIIRYRILHKYVLIIRIEEDSIQLDTVCSVAIQLKISIHLR